MGWLLERHAVVYAKEFGYLPVFETFVAASLVPFLENFDTKRDRLWIAELDGRRVGCVALQHDPKRRGWAKLRWFLLEKEARGLGLGRKLMDRLLRFAKKAGYKGIHFLTVDDLVDARRLYERTGFTMVWEDPKPCPWAPWGHEQVWELPLTTRANPRRRPA
jgi:GNAT superfamily N-acetyltransferase